MGESRSHDIFGVKIRSVNIKATKQRLEHAFALSSAAKGRERYLNKAAMPKSSCR